MNEFDRKERALTAALRVVAADDETRGASTAVEASLLAEVRALARSRRRSLVRHYAVAALLTIAVAAAVWLAAQAPRDGSRMPLAQRAAADPDAGVTEFYPLFYSNVPATDVQLVRLEVSRAALASFGLETGDVPADGSPTILADVIVGEDGLARAIRFVHPTARETPQELRP